MTAGHAATCILTNKHALMRSDNSGFCVASGLFTQFDRPLNAPKASKNNVHKSIIVLSHSRARLQNVSPHLLRQVCLTSEIQPLKPQTSSHACSKMKNDFCRSFHTWQIIDISFKLRKGYQTNFPFRAFLVKYIFRAKPVSSQVTCIYIYGAMLWSMEENIMYIYIVVIAQMCTLVINRGQVAFLSFLCFSTLVFNSSPNERTVFWLTCSLHSVHCSLLPKHGKSVEVYFTSGTFIHGFVLASSSHTSTEVWCVT